MRSAEVSIWGKTVGAIFWDAERQLAQFEYSPEWVKTDIELAPLRMPLNARQRIFSFPELRAHRDCFHGLPGLLADALPDRYGHTLIHRWLEQQGRSKDSMNPAELLCFMGSRGMGALNFSPSMWNENQKSAQIEVEELVQASREALAEKSAFEANLDKDREQSLRSLLRIGTSAGGARPKAVIAYNPETGGVRSGQASAPAGYEHWLLKLDGVSDVQFGASSGYGRVEMAYYRMALDCGIEMMPSRLLIENERAHFMTQRFDRGAGPVRHHMQTLCALQHWDYNDTQSYSYEGLLSTARALRLPFQAAEQIILRMAFNVMSRNCDDHTKNFAFLLEEGGSWKLSPAYDVCHAYRPDSVWVSRHALSVNGKRSEISRSDLMAVAAGVKLREGSWKPLFERVKKVVERWPEYAEEESVQPALRDAINATLRPL
ncbi:MAG: type II toxin-antitoxin system HipA family toxin [Bacteroidota bacterium]|jgi:serine/threonine-protein kinase HipA